MSNADPRCKCTMSQSLTGDGCRYCQPQEYIERLEEWLDEERAELSQSQARVLESIEVAIDMLEDYARALDSGDLDGAGHSTTSCIHEVIDELTAALQPPKDDTQ